MSSRPPHLPFGHIIDRAVGASRRARRNWIARYGGPNKGMRRDQTKPAQGHPSAAHRPGGTRWSARSEPRQSNSRRAPAGALLCDCDALAASMLFDIVNVQNWTALVLPSRFGDAQRSGRPLLIFAGWLSRQSGPPVRGRPGVRCSEPALCP